MTLFRIADLRRELAARLLAGIGDLLGVTDPGSAIATFDGMSDAEVEDARGWLGADMAYRSAVVRLEQY